VSGGWIWLAGEAPARSRHYPTVAHGEVSGCF
jgi:hypothetical protein